MANYPKKMIGKATAKKVNKPWTSFSFHYVKFWYLVDSSAEISGLLYLA